MATSPSELLHYSEEDELQCGKGWYFGHKEEEAASQRFKSRRAANKARQRGQLFFCTQEDGYFGVCPECGQPGKVLHVGRVEFGVCRHHKVAWYIGSNILSSWREQTQDHWDKNEAFLSTCRQVKREIPPNHHERNALPRSATSGDQGDDAAHMPF